MLQFLSTFNRCTTTVSKFPVGSSLKPFDTYSSNTISRITEDEEEENYVDWAAD